MKYSFSKEQLQEAVKNSANISSVCRYLNIRAAGGNFETIKKKIKEYNIDISHFSGQGWNKSNYKFPIEIILQENFPAHSFNLKNRLIKEGIKKHQCEKCKLTEWNNEPIPLQLHHINGITSDNRLENLQLLCPNCHAQTDNYCGKNINHKENSDIAKIEAISQSKFIKASKSVKVSKPVKVLKPIRYCKVCGTQLTRVQHLYCSQKCAHSDKSVKPSAEELQNILFEYKGNIRAVGRFYNVTDSAVNKWIKSYGFDKNIFRSCKA